MIDSHITTALNLSRSTTSTSGAAGITFLDVPQPVASSGGTPPSKRRRHSSEIQHDDDSEICTALTENQCSCGEFFQDRKPIGYSYKGCVFAFQLVLASYHM